MPPKFGAIKRANIYRDTDSNKRNLNLYIISQDEYGKLTESTSTLKQNVKTWLSRYKMINDTVDILNAKIVNIGINFSVTADLETNKYDLLERATRALRTRMLRMKFDIGEPLRVTDIYKILKDVEGLQDVKAVKIVKRTGALYSSNQFNIEQNMTPDGRLLTVPENVVLELKYPETDIVGTVS